MGSGTSKSFESPSFVEKRGILADRVVLRGTITTDRTSVVLQNVGVGDEFLEDVASHVNGDSSSSPRGSAHKVSVSTWDASAASNVRRHRDVSVSKDQQHTSLRLVIEPQASLTSCPSMSITDDHDHGNALSSCCEVPRPPIREAGPPPPPPGYRPTGLRLVIGQQSSLVSVDIRPYEEEMLRSTHVATTAAQSMNSLLLDEQEEQQQLHQSAHMSSFRPLRVVEQEDSEYSFHQTNSWTVHSALGGGEEERNRQQQLHHSTWFMEEGGDGGGAFRHILSKQPTGNVSAVGEPQLFDDGALLVDSRSALAESV